MKTTFLRALATGFLLTGIFSCSPAPAPLSAGNGLRAGDKAINRNSIDAILNNPAERPGLATGWGDRKHSSVRHVDFRRASSKPEGTDVIYYNDPSGISAMAGKPKRVEALQIAAGGLVEWGVKGSRGFLATYKENGFGRRLVAGERGENYSIFIRNRSRSSVEVVASVDGLDVMDGKTASFRKGGYLIGPGESFDIKGFRTSQRSVASFEFSSVSNSYANLRHGDTQNVGVIGIAVFTQKGVDPWAEIDARDSARAFAEAP